MKSNFNSTMKPIRYNVRKKTDFLLDTHFSRYCSVERTQEGNQTVVKTPDYEATSLAMTAQSKLRENAERQYVIIS